MGGSKKPVINIQFHSEARESRFVNSDKTAGGTVLLIELKGTRYEAAQCISYAPFEIIRTARFAEENGSWYQYAVAKRTETKSGFWIRLDFDGFSLRRHEQPLHYAFFG